MHKYRRKTIKMLFFLLFLFLIILIFSYIQFKRKIPIINIGLGYYIEDLVIIGLSVLSIIKVVYEIYQVEHHQEYEDRLKNII